MNFKNTRNVFVLLCYPLLFIGSTIDVLNEKEREVLEHIEKSPDTISTEIVKLDTIPQNHEKCRMLIGDGKIAFDVVEEKRSACVLKWKDDRGSGDLKVSSSRVSGFINYKNQKYSVIPLGDDGKHVVVQLKMGD